MIISYTQGGKIIYKEGIVGSVKIKEFFGFGQKINIVTNKQHIQADGSDTATITFQWQKFDIDRGQYVDDIANTADFQLDIAGTQDTITSTDGQAQIIFSSAEPGEYVIKSTNPGVGNGEVTIRAE